MMRKTSWSWSWIAVTAFAVIPAWGLAETKVELLSVKEVRFKNLAPPPKEEGRFGGSMNFGEQSQLTLNLELQGADVAQAVKYGNITIKSAKDNTGRDLKPAKEGMFGNGPDSFTDIDREQMYFFVDEDKRPKDKIKLDLNLAVPARAAEKITAVEGSLQLQAGTPEKVMVDDVRGKAGTTVEHPLLKKCGVTVQILSPKKGSGGMFDMTPDDPSKAVGVKISGKVDAVMELSVVDAAGKKLNSGSMSFGMNDSKTYWLESDEALPQDAKLAITLTSGLTTVDVPFKLVDIPLP